MPFVIWVTALEDSAEAVCQLTNLLPDVYAVGKLNVAVSIVYDVGVSVVIFVEPL